jgi:hypothetical protein
MGGYVPTIFDFPEMWDLNRSRAGGRFNLIFFWLYPIAAVILLPVTIFCFIERLAEVGKTE